MTDRLEMKNLIEVAKRETVIAKGLSSERESVSLPIDIVLQIIQQAERVEILDEALDEVKRDKEELREKYKALHQQYMCRREALKFYADKENYRHKVDNGIVYNPIGMDEGKKARKALEGDES